MYVTPSIKKSRFKNKLSHFKIIRNELKNQEMYSESNKFNI